jgi:hypothetical protein
MGACVGYSRGRLVYRGRITRAAFDRWTGTPPGQLAIDEAASYTGFSLLGRRWAARRRLWRQLAAAARDESVAAAIGEEAELYLPRTGELAYATGLPRSAVELRRLVVVPRVLLNGATYTAIAKRLYAQPVFAALEGGDALRTFFIERVVQEMDEAIERAHPASGRPLTAGEHWMTIGINRQFIWRVPLLQEPAWNGHHYVINSARDRMSRRVRKAVAAAIEEFESSLLGLSVAERLDILRRASCIA